MQKLPTKNQLTARQRFQYRLKHVTAVNGVVWKMTQVPKHVRILPFTLFWLISPDRLRRENHTSC